MAWLPISNTVLQYVDVNGVPYSGAVLKFYAAGTSTNIPVATSQTGTPTVTSVALNSAGFPAVSGNVVVLFIDQDFKEALYPTQAAADSNTGALWTIDNVDPFAVLALPDNLTDINALTPADSTIIVGNGTDWVAESGATARTSLGLGTGDSPQFTNATLTGLTTGHILLANSAGALTALDLTAKGSIVVGDGAGAPVAVPVSTDGLVLTADSAQASGVKWAPGGSNSIVRVPRTSNTILALSNSSNLIDVTSGTFTQTFEAAATLASGWFCYIRNSGTGDITLDPSGAETIDGLTSFIMYPGEVRLIQCDGTALRSVVLHGFSKTFTASGTFTKPPGYDSFEGLIWSGGNSGQRTDSAVTESAGGGGGGCGNFSIKASSVATTETVTIGAGGAAVTAVANGNSGGTTSFGSHISAFAYTTGGIAWRYGGSIVDQLIAASAPSVGYEGASVGSTTAIMSAVWGGAATQAGSAVPSGNSVYGGAAGGSLSSAAAVRAPGTSKLGGNGGAAASASNGVDGVAPGGGGGATQTGASSGAGARGELRIRGVV